MNNLDLHGISHREVEYEVLNHIGLNNPPFDIITGNSESMLGIVCKVLDESEIDYRVGDFSGVNKGFVRVLNY